MLANQNTRTRNHRTNGATTAVTAPATQVVASGTQRVVSVGGPALSSVRASNGNGR